MGWGMLYCCCVKFQPCLRTALRGEIRKKSGIEVRCRTVCAPRAARRRHQRPVVMRFYG